MSRHWALAARCAALFVALGFVAPVSGAVPVISQGVHLEQVGSIPVPAAPRAGYLASQVTARDGYAYISLGKAFTIYDVSDPAAPQRLGSYEFPEEIWRFRITGSRAYVGANFLGLGILDISDPTAPRLVGTYDTLGQASIAAGFETKVVIIDHMEGLVMVDVSDEAEPVLIGSYYIDGYARDVVTLGSLAFATESPSGLYVFDLSKPGSPEPVSILHAAGAPRAIEVSSAAGGSTLLCGASGGNLQVYDVSDPLAPIRAATFKTPGRAEHVALDGAVAYVADGEAGIQIVDLSTPTKPRLLGSYELARRAHYVSFAGSHVFVIAGDEEDAEVVILRRS